MLTKKKRIIKRRKINYVVHDNARYRLKRVKVKESTIMALPKRQSSQ